MLRSIACCSRFPSLACTRFALAPSPSAANSSCTTPFSRTLHGYAISACPLWLKALLRQVHVGVLEVAGATEDKVESGLLLCKWLNDTIRAQQFLVGFLQLPKNLPFREMRTGLLSEFGLHAPTQGFFEIDSPFFVQVTCPPIIQSLIVVINGVSLAAFLIPGLLSGTDTVLVSQLWRRLPCAHQIDNQKTFEVFNCLLASYSLPT